MNLKGLAVELADAIGAFARAAQRGSRLRSGWSVGWTAALSLTCACNLRNEGISPPEGKLPYPIALAVSKDTTETGAPKYLYVVNTNFDLRYNAGSIQAYDLEALAGRVSRCIGRDPNEPPEQPADAGEEEDAGADPQTDAGPADGDAAGPADDAGVDAGDAAPPELDAGDLDAGDLDAGDLDAGPDASDAAGDARLQPIDAGSPNVRVMEEDAGVRGNLCDGRSRDEQGRRIESDNEEECCFGDPDVLDELRTDEVLVDSYASGLVVSNDGQYLYAPLRSKNRLVYLELGEGGKLECGGKTGRCVRGPDAEDEVPGHEGEAFAPTPASIATGAFRDLGIDMSKEGFEDFVITAHDIGEVSVFGVGEGGEPELLNVTLATSERPNSLRLDPEGQLLYVGAVATNNVERVGLRRVGEGSDTDRILAYRAAPLVIRNLSGVADVRDVLRDSRPSAEGAPLKAYALVRGDARARALLQSVVFLELPANTEDGSQARAVDAVRVGPGASKMLQADVGGRHLLFASCYDAGEIHVIDADQRETVTVIRDVLGPFDMQIDVPRRFLYVTDFRTSVVRVVDLQSLFQRSTETPRVVATLGAPTTPGLIR